MPFFQLLDPLLHLGLDVDDGRDQLLRRRHVVRRRVDVELLALGEQLAGQRIELGDPLDLVAEELHAHDEVVVGRLQLERVAADAEPGADRAGSLRWYCRSTSWRSTPSRR